MTDILLNFVFRLDEEEKKLFHVKIEISGKNLVKFANDLPLSYIIAT